MFYVFITIFLIVILLVLYYVRNQQKVLKEDVVIKAIQKEEIKDIRKEVPVVEIHVRSSYDFSKQSISLLGEFQIKDKNGEDITKLFTPTLRLLFLLLVLSTGEDCRGVSGKEMNRLLWGDKNEYAARNNRNVSLSKIRGILEKVGEVAIVNQDDYWNIQFGEDVVCDYSEIIRFCRAIKNSQWNDESHLDIFLNLLYRGPILCRINYIDWMDDLKIRFSGRIIGILISYLRRTDIDNGLKIRIADTLLRHDALNEDALRVKCHSLKEQDNVQFAKSCYDDYCIRHLNLMGVRYTVSFPEVLKGIQFRS